MFEFRFSWSGTGSIIARCRNPTHRALPIERTGLGGQQVLRIDLGRELGKKDLEIIDFELDTQAIEPAMPHLAVPITSNAHPRLNVHIFVCFGPSVNVGCVYREIGHLNPTGDADVPSEQIELPSSRILYWNPPVRFGLRYKIRWVYNEEIMEGGE